MTDAPPLELRETMVALVQAAILMSPLDAHLALAYRAQELQDEHEFLPRKAEERFLRVIMDGLDFGRWPKMEPGS